MAPLSPPYFPPASAGAESRPTLASHPASPRVCAAAAACGALARPSAAAGLLPLNSSSRRREHLTLHGRITDGSIVDARSHDGEESVSATPDLLLYRYRIAGVTYDCSPGRLAPFPECTAGYRIDQLRPGPLPTPETPATASSSPRVGAASA